MRDEILDCMYVRPGWLRDCMGGEKSKVVVSILTMKTKSMGDGGDWETRENTFGMAMEEGNVSNAMEGVNGGDEHGGKRDRE
jgi:hypothetical protein